MKVELIKNIKDYKIYRALEDMTVTFQCDYPNPNPETNPHNLIKVFIKKGENFTITSFVDSLGVNDFNVHLKERQKDE